MTSLEIFSIVFSLKVALACVLVNLPLALVLSYFLAKYDFKGKIILESFLIFPLVLPPLVTGYILLLILNKNSVLGEFLYLNFGFELVFNYWGAVIASCVVSFPLMFRPIKLSIESINQNYINVSRSLGKSELRTFFLVVLPMSSSGIIAGSVLAFARSLGEFGATIMVAGNIPFKTTTISMAIFSFFNQVDGQRASLRLIIVSIVISLLAMIISEYFSKKGKNA